MCAVVAVNAAYLFRSDVLAVKVFAATLLCFIACLLVLGLYAERHPGDEAESTKETGHPKWALFMNAAVAGLLLVSIHGMLDGL